MQRDECPYETVLHAVDVADEAAKQVAADKLSCCRADGGESDGGEHPHPADRPGAAASATSWAVSRSV